jgi:HD superfamily phosphohydrolase
MTVSKKIFDPIHGFIKLNAIEALLVDSHVFQRLHDIHQLGVTFLVYPGATHSRFEHSLGVMHVASQIFDQISAKYQDTDISSDFPYWRQIVRLAALSHDLGHLPFSHVAEKRLLGKGGHEKWTLKVLESSLMQPIWDRLKEAYPAHDVQADVIKVSLGEEKLKEMAHPLSHLSFSDWEKVMTQVITGDFFGADRIDYLLRDARCTGLSYGLFDYQQLIEMLRILPSSHGHRLVLGIEENGIESCEALLLARHFMHKRVYQYHSVKAYSFHMSRYMKSFYDRGTYLTNLNDYLSLTDSDILVAIKNEVLKNQHPHLDAAALFYRKNRYLSLQLPDSCTEQILQQFLSSHAMSSADAEWSLEDKMPYASSTFPVLKKNGRIVDGAECSKLLVPPCILSWIYLPSQFSEDLTSFLFSLEQQRGEV